MEIFKNLNKGQILSETSFFKVIGIKGNIAELEAEDGKSVNVDKGYIDSFMSSGDLFSTEEKVTRTAMTEILLKNARTAMTVNFQKQVKEADVLKEVIEAQENSTPKDFAAKAKATIKRAMNGEERTMRGRHYGHVNEFGRIPFIDMEEEKEEGSYDNRFKQVDPRTLNWLIVNNIKYVIKK